MSPHCDQCGAWVTKGYKRVIGDRDGVLDQCRHCEGHDEGETFKRCIDAQVPSAPPTWSTNEGTGGGWL
jgi:hypothetical protein